MMIRPMTEADIPAAIELWGTCDGVGLGEGDTAEGTVAFLTRNPGTSWVALVDGQLQGAVLGGHDGRRGFLYHLAVHSDHRRRGCGVGLVKACLASLRAAGILKCHVMVFRDNAAGREFWAHLGFRLRSDLDVCTCVLERGA